MYAGASLKIWYSELKLQLKKASIGPVGCIEHLKLVKLMANATPYISTSYDISRKQKTGIPRSRYPNRAVTVYRILVTLYIKISGYATEIYNW